MFREQIMQEAAVGRNVAKNVIVRHGRGLLLLSEA